MHCKMIAAVKLRIIPTLPLSADLLPLQAHRLASLLAWQGSSGLLSSHAQLDPCVPFAIRFCFSLKTNKTTSPNQNNP